MEAVVLVIDDDEDMRALMVWILRSAYTVVEACDYQGAVAQLDQLRGRVCAVVSDLIMSGDQEAGVKVFAEAARSHPNAARITVTGSGSPEVPLAHRVIPKPFDPTDLLAAVRAAIASVALAPTK